MVKSVLTGIIVDTRYRFWIYQRVIDTNLGEDVNTDIYIGVAK